MNSYKIELADDGGLPSSHEIDISPTNHKIELADNGGLPPAWNSNISTNTSQAYSIASTLTSGSEEAVIITIIERWVQKRPEALAVNELYEGQSLTYRELWERSGWLMSALVEAGVKKGDLIAIDLPRSADMVIAFLGTIRAGAAYLPLDPLAPSDRVIGILKEAAAKLIICSPSTSRVPASVIQLFAIPHQSPMHQMLPETVTGNDPIYVTYTSGSTGRPKGVVIPHRGVTGLVLSPRYFVIESDEYVANLGNPAFDITTLEIWCTLAAGATIVPFPPFPTLNIDTWLALLHDKGITTMFLTTSLFHTIAWEWPHAFSSLRNLLVGGEQLDRAAALKVLEAGPPMKLINAYGPTEGTVLATYFECTKDSLTNIERVPIGYVAQQTELFVLDDNLQPTPVGKVGELCLSGLRLAIEYLKRPELTRERFVLEPKSQQRIYRTGDLVKQLSNGALEMVGRKDRQIKLRGFRIELEEIERAIVATGLVVAAFVEKVGMDASATLVGFILPMYESSEKKTVEELTQQLPLQLAKQLPTYMVPTRWLLLSELPLTAAGKADRVAMIAMLAPLETVHEVSLLDEQSEKPTFIKVKNILQDMLKISQLSTEASFVELGGNSILAMRTAYRIRQQLGLPLEPSEVLRAPSMSDLINHLSDLASSTS